MAQKMVDGWVECANIMMHGTNSCHFAVRLTQVSAIVSYQLVGADIKLAKIRRQSWQKLNCRSCDYGSLCFV